MSIIVACSRGHNASTTLMIDGEIIFYVEEERLSRFKRDGTPLMGLAKVFDYVDHIDELVVCHTHRSGPQTDWTAEDLYKAWIRKLSKRKFEFAVTFIDMIHHQMHAQCGFINSGFDTAACVVADGAGSFLRSESYEGTLFEFETIFKASKVNDYTINQVYKHLGTDESVGFNLVDKDTSTYVTEFPGIVKAYEAITRYCGFNSIEAGKTMGLSPYGKPNSDLPPLVRDGWVNRDVFQPNYPNGAYVICDRYPLIDADFKSRDSNEAGSIIKKNGKSEGVDNTKRGGPPVYESQEYSQLQKDLAYSIQEASEIYVGDLIQKAHDMTGEKNIVVSGGYGLNCVANYKFKKRFPDLNIFVEPISHDGGTSIGGAYTVYIEKYLRTKKSYKPIKAQDSIYYGPLYNPESHLGYFEWLNDDRIKITDASYDSVAKLIRDGNIVTIFQGKSEGGPRALGNRSILFDPTIKDGKDIINKVKHREFFRPFACSILADKVHDWFDLAGMEDTPHMMYAVECQPGVEEKIPSVIHVDGTCRIQTVTKEQNEHYYNLISAFEKFSDTPILFNTSFNLGGDPLVETIEDAADTLSKSDINYMYLPEVGKLVEVPFNMKQSPTNNVLKTDSDIKI
tara:strand:- start:71 stop:1939 length:1869 start_codon:yes stop_codon:yes gene_type:complete